MINVDFYKTFLPRILFHEEKNYPTLVLSVCRYVSQCGFFLICGMCSLVRHCVFVCIFLCLCLCLCFHSLMSVFVFVPVFISLYNLSTALFNLFITVVKCITSIQWSNARHNVKDQNNSALLFNNIQLFFFTLNSLFIPILFQF